MKVIDVKHAWIKDELIIDRPDGFADMYLFLHFWNPMQVMSDNKKMFTSSNACIIYSPGEAQFATTSGKWQHDWVIVTPEIKDTLDKLDIETGRIYYPRNYKFITDIIRKIEIEHAVNDKYSDEICECLLTELFTVFSREISDNKNSGGLNRQTRVQLEQLRKDISVNYTKKWDINDMANYINLSPSYLYSAYKKLYGVSPIQDLINTRIQHSKTMLAETQRSIKDISEWLGYTYPSHFIRQFTKKVGISPLKYRQNNMLEHRNDFILPKGT